LKFWNIGEISELLIREKYYLAERKLLKPEYNIAQDPTAPMSGRKHSDETKQIISDAKKGSNHPMYGKNHTEETKKKKYLMLLKDNKDPQEQEVPLKFQAIEVTDIKNDTTTSYDSMSAAAIALNINIRRISDYFVRNQVKPYKGRYTFKKL